MLVKILVDADACSKTALAICQQIANRAGVLTGDIAITQDLGLAALVLDKKVLALSPSGREYCPDKMEFLLEEREVKAKLRRSGRRTKGP